MHCLCLKRGLCGRTISHFTINIALHVLLSLYYNHSSALPELMSRSDVGSRSSLSGGWRCHTQANCPVPSLCSASCRMAQQGDHQPKYQLQKTSHLPEIVGPSSTERRIPARELLCTLGVEVDKRRRGSSVFSCKGIYSQISGWQNQKKI